MVTGAGRGIGRALVEELHSRGHVVIALVRNQSDVHELQKAMPPSVHALRCDVMEASTERVLRQFIEALSVQKIDLLINNAGFGATGYGISGLDYKELDDVLSVHCHGPIRCVRACLPFLRASSRAVVVNISSRFGSIEWVSSCKLGPNQSSYPYRIGKAALNMLTSCLAVELKDDGIRVLSVDPGKVKTRFGPKDADTEPADAARAILDLVAGSRETAQFVRASGEKLPW